LLNELLTTPVQDFIRVHEHDDERLLVLKYRHVHGVPASKIAEQIAGRRKAREKLPSYYQTASILYPPGLNLEQSSSEKLVDLTGGFGIDTFFFSKLFKHVAYVEPDTALLDLARHNHAALQAHNISYHPQFAQDFLDTHRETADCIYIDPSRRKGSQKVFRLADCEPDVTLFQQQVFEHARYLLIKTSPLFDIQQGLRELHAVKKVFVVSVGNECKELLFLCEQNFTGEATITAVNLNAEHREDFTFTVLEEKESALTFSSPLEFIFEPNASLLKAGAFRIAASRFALAKLHSSTHLYTSNNLLEDFPGRIFKVEAILKSDPKIIAQHFPDGKANVITRNYPLSVDALKKKLKLNDGGEKYLLAFTGPGEKFLCKASRIN
jgi:hypothetical protein